MKTIRAFVERRSVATYFLLVFVISWGGVLMVVGPGGIPAANQEQLDTLFPIAILAMVAGPSVAGILMTGLLHGRAGLREFGSRLLEWRVGARWYVVALLAAPLLFAAVSFALSLFSPEFLPGILTTDDKASVLLMGIFAGLMAGIFEELGWTGFATPTLLRLRYGVLGTGLIVGLPWAVWHLLVAFWASGAISGEFALASYLLDPFLFLVAFRVLMVWVYDRTSSLLVAGILMHVSLTASTLILGAGLVGVPLFAFDFVWAAVLWAAIATVAMANGWRLSRHPQPPIGRRAA
jgi:membrane protease YdiL (CAAX protease family)